MNVVGTKVVGVVEIVGVVISRRDVQNGRVGSRNLGAGEGTCYLATALREELSISKNP